MMAQVQSLPSIDTVDNKQSTDELSYMTTPSSEYLNREEDRLRTFMNRWPIPFVQPEELARYGFYYTGSEDTVKCFFCRVEIGMWEQHDNVIEEHLRWSPYCPLLKKRQTNNEPINANFLSAVPEPSFDVCGINMRQHSYAENAGDRMSGDSWVSDASSTSSSSTGSSVGEASGTISTDRSGLVRSGADAGGMMLTAAAAPHGTMLMGAMRRPEYPNYAIEADRLKSFADWPTSMYQKPQQLSDAGFFYTGNGDRVKCYSCGGGLKDWEQGDEPWEQHGIWYSNCEYLKLIKGHEFIQKCQQMREDEEAQTNGGQHSRPSTSGASSAASSLMSTSPVSSRSGVSSPTAPDDECTLRRCDSGLATATEDGQQEGEDETGTRNISDGKICKICFVNEYNTAFLPCGHVVACAKCASSVTKCPLCQQPFINVLRLYLS